MTRSWRAAILLLAGACASGGGTPAPSGPSPSAPTGPGTMVSPGDAKPAQNLRYPRSGTGISRYAFARRDSVVATMPTGESQQLVFGRTAYLTLTWIAADSGTRITASVDSLVPDSAVSSSSLTMLDSALGARWTALRTPSGRLTGLTGGAPSLTGDQIRDQLVLLFPLLPLEGARSGERWTDSLQGPARISAFEAIESVIAHSEAGTPEGSGALPIQVARQRTASGKASQFGQALTVKGEGLDSLAYQLGWDGRVLSVTGQRHTSIVVQLPSIGQSVPAEEMSLFRMTLLR